MDATALAKHILELEPNTGFLERAEQQMTPKTLAALVKTLRASAVLPPQLAHARAQWECPVVDVCGTGGSKTSRLNTSTLVAMFAPDLGYAVIKHGGRSASGKVGSLDLLEKLGLDVAFLYEHSAESLRATGLCYLGAGFTYSAFARYSSTRKSFGKPSVFNVLGPLLNPTEPTTRLLGAYQKSVAHLLAHALVELNEDALVVCSEDSEGTLDEASPYGTTFLYDVSGGAVRTHEIPPVEKLAGKRTDLFENSVQAALDFLDGKDNPEANAALHFVAYNLACLAVLKASPEVRENFLTALPATYEQIKHTFGARLKCAEGRLAKLRNLKPLHDFSPTKLGCKILNEPEGLGFSVQEGRKTQSAKPHAALKFVPSSTEQNFELRTEHRTQQTAEQKIHSQKQFEKVLSSPLEMSRGILFAEIKIRTPLRAFESPLDLETRVKSYSAADAISVVTHPQFGGSLELLSRLRSLTGKPILAKDFVRQSSEVERLVACGANGILLLQDMLSSAELAELVNTCVQLKVTPFVESSWTVPTNLPPSAFAVLNSRNLFSLEEGRRFRDEAARRLGPQARAVLASSLSLPAEIFLALQEHAGVIVGSALMKIHSEHEIKQFLNACTRTRPLLKACGARNMSDVEGALESGADFVGVNLIPTSKRFVTEDFLNTLLSAGSAFCKHIVFVTAGSTPPALLAKAAQFAWGAGVEKGAYEQPYGAPLLAGGLGLFATHPSTHATAGANVLVLDSSVPGSGRAESYPSNLEQKTLPVFAAGGVHTQNVLARIAEAAEQGWNVAGVDVASGIENTSASEATGGFDKGRIRELNSALNVAHSKV